MTVYQNRAGQDPPFEVKEFSPFLNLPHNILDIGKVNITITGTEKENRVINGILVFSCEAQDSFSNFLYVYNFSMDYAKNSITFWLKRTEYAYTLGLNTFKITQILKIPFIHIVILIDENIGAIVYDISNFQILKIFDAREVDAYYSQDLIS